MAAERGESGSFETSKSFAEEYTKTVRQVLLEAGRLVTDDYSGGFLVRNHYQLKLSKRIEYGYSILGTDAVVTPTGALQVSGRYDGTV